MSPYLFVTTCSIPVFQVIPFRPFRLSSRSTIPIGLVDSLLGLRCSTSSRKWLVTRKWILFAFSFFFLFLMFEDQINCPSFISPRPHTHRTTPIGEQVKYDARFCNYCHLTKRVLTVFIKIQQNSFPFLASPFQNILPTISMQYGQVSFENTWK